MSCFDDQFKVNERACYIGIVIFVFSPIGIEACNAEGGIDSRE